ncbi:MAG: acyl carrier protein [Candidatus Omnitrophota bacterium]
MEKNAYDPKVIETVDEILNQYVQVCKQGVIKPQDRLIEDLGLDSLNLIEICIALEEAFAMCVSDEDMEKLKTVEDVYAYAERQKGKR